MTEINPVQTNAAPTTMPVTKEETESFFQRLATNFVASSNQARELETMRYDIQRLNQRLDTFIEENNKLKAEITTAYELMKSIEVERDTAKRDLADEQNTTAHLREQLNSLHDDVTARANRVAELERQVSELQASLQQTTNERDSFKDNRDYWQQRAGDYEARLNQERDHSNQLGHAYSVVCSERDKLTTRLNQMKAILSPPEEQTQAQRNDGGPAF